MGGFDTHSNQLTQQDFLFNDLNQSLSAFDQATVELDLSPNVTTFILSDFDRAYSANSTGTDHAWGSHHLIRGRAVTELAMVSRIRLRGASRCRYMSTRNFLE